MRRSDGEPDDQPQLGGARFDRVVDHAEPRAFREVVAAAIRAGAWSELEYDTTILKRIYRLSAEATGPAAAAKGILTPSGVEEMIAGLIRLEDDGSSVVVKFPDIWVIAKR